MGGVREQVLEAAEARAEAMKAGDSQALTRLLHPDFRWTSHTGEQFDRAAYVRANTGGRTTWRGQDLGDPEILVAEGAAVLRTTVVDLVGESERTTLYRMPMTQVWVLTGQGWKCLAGHAGPRLRD
ncbi:nuclear transport factor 2 family protein [Sinomonas susongensis]|uniref:nuclear transport factor 2 family protein n=1 Tax=Sinomonas susongensis TaxID=1324851 RepID=UPI001107D1A3|nr:nuclear transport factor 2 family protein [Sinomonas susongensis]